VLPAEDSSVGGHRRQQVRHHLCGWAFPSFSRTVIASYALSQAFEHRSPLFCLSYVLWCAYESRVVSPVAQSKKDAGAAISSLSLLLMPCPGKVHHHVGKVGLSAFFSILLGGHVLVTDSRILGVRSSCAGHILAFWLVPILTPDCREHVFVSRHMLKSYV
jgi:hypothetical protein